MARLIKQINFPTDLRKFKKENLKQISDELRDELIDVVSETGGHLGAGLGVVELTIALHYVFDTPKDKLVWDVSHQCYPHKIITGRRDRIRTLRKGGGLSGFTKRTESEYDPFGAAHSSTSISSPSFPKYNLSFLFLFEIKATDCKQKLNSLPVFFFCISII